MTDQNYTIARIVGEPKTYGDKTRFAFTCNETGETVHSLFTKFPDNIKAGAALWGHLEEQQKDGKTYSNFFFGKDNPNKRGGMSENDKAMLVKASQDSYAALTQVKALTQYLKEQGVIKDVIPGTSVEYPKGPDPKKAGFDTSEAESISFDGDAELESLMKSAEEAMR